MHVSDICALLWCIARREMQLGLKEMYETCVQLDSSMPLTLRQPNVHGSVWHRSLDGDRLFLLRDVEFLLQHLRGTC